MAARAWSNASRNPRRSIAVQSRESRRNALRARSVLDAWRIISLPPGKGAFSKEGNDGKGAEAGGDEAKGTLSWVVLVAACAA